MDAVHAPILITFARCFTLYMKIYAENRGLATCTGIPDFPYKEDKSNFPSFDYPTLRRVIELLGGLHVIHNADVEEIAEFYAQSLHKRFAFYLEAFLEAGAHSVKTRLNEQGALHPFRVLLDQFLTKEINHEVLLFKKTISEFAEKSLEYLQSRGEIVAKSDYKFSEKWREYVPEKTNKKLSLQLQQKPKSMNCLLF